jgi:hypothetical protein
MKKYFILALAILALGSYVTSEQLFSYPGVKLSGFASNQLADDGGTIAIVKYFGTAELATIDAVSNTFEFHISSTAGGSAAAPTADTAADVEVDDLCGDVAGAIDIADAQCDTWGELTAYINKNSADHRFVMVLIGALPTDTVDATFYTDPADANLKVPGGFAIESDSSDHDVIYSLVAPWQYRALAQDDIRAFVDDQGDLRKNVVSEDLIPFLTYAAGAVNGTSTITFRVYSANYETNNDGTPVVTLLWSEAITNNTYTEFFEDKQPLVGLRGEVLLVRITAGSAMLSAELQVQGAFGRLE